MATYSLLQISLDQRIDRAVLEEASVAAPAVARADCAVMERDQFGILVSALPREDAVAFQTALRERGYPTELVEDSEIPILHEAFTIQRIAPGREAVVFTDSMGREMPRPLEDLVFVAGGMLRRTKSKAVWVTERADSGRHKIEQVRQHRDETIAEFRMDFFFWSEPNRLRAIVSAESTVFFRERPMRLRDTALLLGAMMDLRELLPPERVGSGLKRNDVEIAYPSPHAYEEEIRWHFHQFRKKV
jgi:hypothetical protein